MMSLITRCIIVGLVAVPVASIGKDRSAPASPIGSPGDWFPANSYPADAKRNGEQGRVSVELAVDKTGKPTNCTLVSSSGSASLDAKTCDLAIANGRFTPAKDTRGQPIASHFAVKGVRWELIDDYNLDLSAGPVSTTMRNVEVMLDEQGKIISCRSLASTSGGSTGCEGFRLGTKVTRPLFLNGKPVSGKMTITTTMLVEPK